jgi:L-amino acid N-acyltransferase YncA
MKIQLEPMTAESGREIIDIFNYYIENSFNAYRESTVPYQFFENFLQTCADYPAIVAKDGTGSVLGFGMLKAYKPAPTFAQTAEIMYFLRPGRTGQGIGKDMLDHLVREGKKKGLTTILASISSLNEGSLNFHRKNGFVECGRFKNICRKKNRLFDIVYMQKML